jgi:hypothetical protein
MVCRVVDLHVVVHKSEVLGMSNENSLTAV